MADGERGETGKAPGPGSGYVKVVQAARALGVTDRTVRRWVSSGRLEGRKVQRGQSGAIEISIDSVQRVRDQLVTEGALGEGPDPRDGERLVGETEAEGSVDRAIERLFARVEETASENGRLRGRLEITERAESTRRREADDLRRRAERAEEERAAAREELAAANAELELLREREGREGRETGPGASFWRRLLGRG